jgi:hypothetical protein
MNDFDSKNGHLIELTLMLSTDRTIDCVYRLQRCQVAPGPTFLHAVWIIKKIAGLG